MRLCGPATDWQPGLRPEEAGMPTNIPVITKGIQQVCKTDRLIAQNRGFKVPLQFPGFFLYAKIKKLFFKTCFAVF